MKRRALLLAALASLAPGAHSQQRVHRIALLALDDSQSLGGTSASLLRAALRGIGYEEGRNLRIEERWASGDFAKLDAFAHELARLDMDALVAITNYEIAALKRAGPRAPIVMYFGALPVELGFVQSLSRPGGNITGTAYHSDETAGKIVGLLREAAPAARRTALLWNPDFPGMRIYGAAANRAAESSGMSIEYFDAERPSAVPPALSRIAAYKPDALFVAYDSIISTRLDEITAFARERRFVSIGTSPVFADFGGCLAYGPNLQDVAQRTASHIDRILRGARAAELPVEQPRKFELVVNLATARAIGYSPPRAFLSRADRVIG